MTGEERYEEDFNEELERMKKAQEIAMRDEFAKAALPYAVEEIFDLDVSMQTADWPSRIATCAYLIADAMLEARKKYL